MVGAVDHKSKAELACPQYGVETICPKRKQYSSDYESMITMSSVVCKGNQRNKPVIRRHLSYECVGDACS